MSEATTVIKAFTTQWRNSSALRDIPIRSTRIAIKQSGTAAAIFPYALVQSAVIRHKFSSANYRLTWYLVTLTVYAGNLKADLNTYSDAIAALFDRNIGLPVVDNCVVMEAQAVAEDPDLDPDDYYGSDVNVLRQPYKILLNETIGAVKSALAT